MPVLLLGQQADVGVKTAFAKRSTDELRIDGLLDDAAWEQAVPITGFIQNEPKPGEPASQKTEVRILYDDHAIYIGARMYDTSPDSILNELSERDQMGNADYFGLSIDTYLDGLNGLGFIVTPAGVEYDLKYSALAGGFNPRGPLFGGDRKWDAVWQVRTRIDEQGWVAEMAIPYSALRFPNTEVQHWGINFARHIRRYRETSFWNPVDPDEKGFLRQAGHLEGVKHVKAPLRLSATPFVSGTLIHEQDPTTTPAGSSWSRAFSAGMDIRYGINDAFTLDMTLIPDFGEARSDEQVLNLTPFEVKFDENRQFFLEGTELFNKGNFFYSRRVGQIPYAFRYRELPAPDSGQIYLTPSETQLINATKISGRTKKGTGLGFFNALTAPAHSLLIDEESGEEVGKEEIYPLSNYNVFVIDQNLPNNSYLTFLNTNVWRDGAAYDANLSGLIYDLRDKANRYSLNGKVALSQQYLDTETALGHSMSLTLDNISGPWQGGLGYSMESDTYDPNDLGFLYRNNQQSISGKLSYRRNEPFTGPFSKKNKFNSGGAFFFAQYDRLYHPNVFTGFSLSAFNWLVTQNFTAFGTNLNWSPGNSYDYYEARVSGRFFLQPTRGNGGIWISSDYRKPIAFDLNADFGWSAVPGQYYYSARLQPRFRLSDRFNFNMDFSNEQFFNDRGYYGIEGEDIIFSYRDVHTVVLGTTINYNFSPRITFNLRLRHYWSQVRYKSFHQLLEDGTLGTPLQDNSNRDPAEDFNAFTIDAVFRWRFAPGSDLYLIWKNKIEASEGAPALHQTYLDNLSGLTQLPRSNTFSLKLIYYLDYQALL